MKSFLIVLFALLSVLTFDSYSQENLRIEVLSSEQGRYVFGQISSMRRDQYMLDTNTGKLWQIIETKEGAHLLEPILYVVGDELRFAPDEKDVDKKAILNYLDKKIQEYENSTQEQKVIKNPK